MHINTIKLQTDKTPIYTKKPVTCVQQTDLDSTIIETTQSHEVSRNSKAAKFNSNSSSFDKPFHDKRQSHLADIMHTRPDSLVSETSRRLKSSVSFTALQPTSNITSARSRVIEEQNQLALKKKQEQERINQLRKAREIGNRYSSSYSRDSRSQQRMSQQREARQKVVQESPEKEEDISNIDITLDVSSIKNTKDDTLDS